MAIGAAGIAVLDDLRGTPDADGREMRSTIIAVDQLASAADLAGGKVGQRPVVIHGRRSSDPPRTIPAPRRWSCHGSRTSSLAAPPAAVATALGSTDRAA